MRPVATRAELALADARRIAEVGLDALVDAAGYALSLGARRTLRAHQRRTAGTRVVVVAGPGLNGADGRAAARVLTRLGAAVRVEDAASVATLEANLVLDCAFGTGVSRPVSLPSLVGHPLVVACDLPSGLDAEDGTVHGTPWRAAATVAFGALKPGLCYPGGLDLAGVVAVDSLRLDVGEVAAKATEASDLAEVCGLDPNRHKWTTAVAVVAGSPGMDGAATLACAGAMAAGAGMVRLLGDGSTLPALPSAVVLDRRSLDARALLEATARCGAIVLGPGLGRSVESSTLVRTVLLTSAAPVVLDADGLAAFDGAEDLRGILERRPSGAPTLLTPHDGEYRGLLGTAPGPDRIVAARRAAAATGATVLLKGRTTVVVDPRGATPYLVVDAPSQLATAGSGDVLAGICGALLARSDLDSSVARRAALGATWHAEAGRLGHRVGCLSSDLPDLVAEVGSRWSVANGC